MIKNIINNTPLVGKLFAMTPFLMAATGCGKDAPRETDPMSPAIALGQIAPKCEDPSNIKRDFVQKQRALYKKFEAEAQEYLTGFYAKYDEQNAKRIKEWEAKREKERTEYFDKTEKAEKENGKIMSGMANSVQAARARLEKAREAFPGEKFDEIFAQEIRKAERDIERTEYEGARAAGHKYVETDWIYGLGSLDYYNIMSARYAEKTVGFASVNAMGKDGSIPVLKMETVDESDIEAEKEFRKKFVAFKNKYGHLVQAIADAYNAVQKAEDAYWGFYRKNKLGDKVDAIGTVWNEQRAESDSTFLEYYIERDVAILELVRAARENVKDDAEKNKAGIAEMLMRAIVSKTNADKLSYWFYTMKRRYDGSHKPFWIVGAEREYSLAEYKHTKEWEAIIAEFEILVEGFTNLGYMDYYAEQNGDDEAKKVENWVIKINTLRADAEGQDDGSKAKARLEKELAKFCKNVIR